jgi:MFS transporter, DHA2 family, methylenomycin A resistance protein
MTTTSAHVPAPVQAPPRRRAAVLVTMCVGLFLVQLDVTVVNVALPRIGAGLHASGSGLQWVVDGYAVPFAALLLAGGASGDRWGHRRTALTGLLVFGAGSALCALAPATGVLIAARAAQGVGAAALLPATLAVVTHTFPGARERARAIGVWAAVAGLALPAGPLVGGLLVAGPGWRAVFWLNVPLVAAALAAVPAVVPRDRSAVRPAAARLDLRGTVLGACALATCTVGLIEGGRTGWAPAVAVPAVLGTAALAAAFWLAERRHPAPMLPPSLFRDGRFTVANAAAGAMNLVGIGTLFLVTLYLQEVRHLSPLAAGAALLPMFAPVAGLAPLAGRLTARVGPRRPAVCGLLLGAAGTALLTLVGQDTGYLRLVPALVLLGVGLGLLTAPLVSTAVGAVPRERAGLAGGVNNTARQAGGAVGVALFGALAGPASTPSAFVTGLHAAGLTAAALYVAAAAACAVRLPDGGR